MSESQSSCAPEENPEQWRPLVGWEWRYEVSDRGRIRSLDTRDNIGRRRAGRVLRNARISGRYMQVRLGMGGKIFNKCVHIAVLEAFVGPRPLGMHGCHDPDRDTSNNRLSNLRWDTPSANHRDKIAHGTIACGSRNGWAKITESQARFIITAYKNGVRPSVISSAIGVNRNHVTNIATGKWWSHIKPLEICEKHQEVFNSLAAASRRLHGLRTGIAHVRRADKRKILRRELDDITARINELVAVAITWSETNAKPLTERQ